MSYGGRFALLILLASFVLLAGCANPNDNVKVGNCCPKNETVYDCEINKVLVKVDCTGSDGANVCYNVSNMSQGLAPICPQMNKTGCVDGDCMMMSCLQVKNPPKPPVTLDDTKPDTTPARNVPASGGLVGKYCKFTPMDALNSRLLKRAKDGFVNSFRLGMMGDYSDYDRGRFYFEPSDYYGSAPSRDSLVDRFVSYVDRIRGSTSGMQGTCTCVTFNQANINAPCSVGAPVTTNVAGKTYCQNSSNVVSCNSVWQPKTICNYAEWPKEFWEFQTDKPRICEPRNASDYSTFVDALKWTCTAFPHSNKFNSANSTYVGDADFVIEDYGNNSELARLACNIGCRVPLECADNQDLLVKSNNIAPPTVQNNSRPFVNIGRLNQFGAKYPYAEIGDGYGQLLFNLYSAETYPAGCKMGIDPGCSISPYVNSYAPGPIGALQYECISGKDCMSGVCTNSVYQRSACLDANGDTIDCGCVKVNSCEEWFGDCTRNFNSDGVMNDYIQEQCKVGLELCRGAKRSMDGPMILCLHDTGWKGNSSGWGPALPPIRPAGSWYIVRTNPGQQNSKVYKEQNVSFFMADWKQYYGSTPQTAYGSIVEHTSIYDFDKDYATDLGDRNKGRIGWPGEWVRPYEAGAPRAGAGYTLNGLTKAQCDAEEWTQDPNIKRTCTYYPNGKATWEINRSISGLDTYNACVYAPLTNKDLKNCRAYGDSISDTYVQNPAIGKQQITNAVDECRVIDCNCAQVRKTGKKYPDPACIYICPDIEPNVTKTNKELCEEYMKYSVFSGKQYDSCTWAGQGGSTSVGECTCGGTCKRKQDCPATWDCRCDRAVYGGQSACECKDGGNAQNSWYGKDPIASPSWQAISAGTTKTLFSQNDSTGGAAYVFASPNYLKSGASGPAYTNTSLWNGSKEQLMETFPFIKACEIGLGDIEQTDVYSFVNSTPNPGDMIYNGKEVVLTKAFRITNFGKCQVDSKGWPIIMQYGICQPNTMLTMAYQKITDAYSNNDTNGSKSGYNYGVKGYCPKDCDYDGAKCDCSKAYYNQNYYPYFGTQAPHANPELFWLSRATAIWQSYQILPVLDIRGYTYNPASGMEFETTADDACLAELGTEAVRRCSTGSDYDCENDPPAGSWAYKCKVPKLPDPLLGFLGQNHSAAILVMAGTSENFNDVANKITAIAAQCPKCMLAVDNDKPSTSLLDVGAPDFDSKVAQVSSDIRSFAGIGSAGPVQTQLKSNGIDKISLVVLHFDLFNAGSAPGGYGGAAERMINASRAVLNETNWPTLIVIDRLGHGTSTGAYDYSETYKAITDRSADFVNAGAIGVMLPPLNGSGEEYIVRAGDTYQNAPMLCAAQEGVRNLLTPKLVSTSVQIMAKNGTCQCVPCGEEDIDLGLCNETCVDGVACNRGSLDASVPAMCEPICVRNNNCDLCTNTNGLYCNRMDSSNGKFELTTSFDVPTDALNQTNGPVNAGKIGTLDKKCCVETKGGKMTYMTEYSIRTNADPVIYPRFANNKTDCGIMPKLSQGGQTCEITTPVVDNKVDFCVYK